MKLTKYVHSCMVLEEQGKKVIVDPGVWTPEFGDAENVAAVVVTHVHDDHFGEENVLKIATTNPDVKIYATREVAEQLQGTDVVVPEIGKDYAVGPFTLRFNGETHAVVHSILPRFQNIGVMINGVFYYPGDSFNLPEQEVTTVALPAGGGWMKVGDAIDFMQATKAKQYIPVHEIALSDLGRQWAFGNYTKAAAQFGTEFTTLKPGDSVEI